MSNRILRDSINRSEGLSECSSFTQDLYKRLILCADDFGRMLIDFNMILIECYPREQSTISNYDILNGLIELVGENKLKIYTNKIHQNKIFAFFPKWSKHQRIRNKYSKFPEPLGNEINEWLKLKYLNKQKRIILYIKSKYQCERCKSKFSIKKVSPLRNMWLVENILKINYLESKELICCSCLQDSELKLTTNFLLTKHIESKSSKSSTGNLFIPEMLPATPSKKTVEDNKDKIPYQEIEDAYHRICIGLPKIVAMTDERKKKINARWKQCIKEKRDPMGTFIDVFERLNANPFYNGENDSGWKAGIDYIINPNKWVIILEKIPRPEDRIETLNISEIDRKAIEECYKRNNGNCGAFRYGNTEEEKCKICIKLHNKKYGKKVEPEKKKKVLTDEERAKRKAAYEKRQAEDERMRIMFNKNL